MSVTMRRVRLGAPAAIAVMLALAACQTRAPQVMEPETRGSSSTSGAAGAVATNDDPAYQAEETLARNLGLVAPVGEVKKNQFQLVGADGAFISRAEVVVGDFRGFTDAKGMVTMPIATANLGRQPAIIRAPGYVPMEMDIVPGFAARLPQVDAQRTTITAAAGGKALNSAGNMEVIFPPGSLTGDAKVAVTRVYGQWGLPGQRLPEQMPFTNSSEKDGPQQSFADAGYKLADNVPLGTYHYSLDLGEGVSLAPGAQAVVRFKAEGPMEALLADRYAAGDTFSEQAESVTRDSEGHFWLAMQVVGPVLQGATTGGARVAPLQRRLMAAECQTFNDQEAKTFWVAKTWASMTPGIQIPIWKNGYRTSDNISVDWVNQYAAVSGGGCTTWQTAAQYEKNSWNMAKGSTIPGWITLVTHNSKVNGGRCVYYQFDPNQYYCEKGRIKVKDPGGEWQTTYTTWISKSINALVNWSSDDPRLSGVVPGAQVNFSHSLSPLRANTPLTVIAASDGYASTLGLDGSAGSASASVPGQAGYTFSNTSGYRVDCRTVNLRIYKNMPRVTLQSTAYGTPSAPVVLKTTLGDFTLPSLANATVKPTIPLDAPSASFRVNGSHQTAPNEWVEMVSDALDAGWNTTRSLPTTFWVSRPLSASLVYQSNDASLAADGRPASVWDGQPVGGASLTFAHAQSAYPNKTRQEPLTFANVNGSAATWGIRGATSNITAERSSNGITLSGSATGVVDGSVVSVPVSANLPSLTIRAIGPVSGSWVVNYDLEAPNGSVTTRSTTVQGQGSQLVLTLPVEDPLNQPGKHTFRLTSILSADGTTRMNLPAVSGLTDYPSVTGLHRGGSFQYPVELSPTFVAPK
ncbi:MAG: hypothetical protein VKP62_14530 [Candidatus Sericytochromatia bacterium]|nr:hypothetical protein [Candidatus Sericytochromatia bacterium]